MSQKEGKFNPNASKVWAANSTHVYECNTVAEKVDFLSQLCQSPIDAMANINSRGIPGMTLLTDELQATVNALEANHEDVEHVHVALIFPKENLRLGVYKHVGDDEFMNSPEEKLYDGYAEWLAEDECSSAIVITSSKDSAHTHYFDNVDIIASYGERPLSVHLDENTNMDKLDLGFPHHAVGASLMARSAELKDSMDMAADELIGQLLDDADEELFIGAGRTGENAAVTEDQKKDFDRFKAAFKKIPPLPNPSKSDLVRRNKAKAKSVLVNKKEKKERKDYDKARRKYEKTKAKYDKKLDQLLEKKRKAYDDWQKAQEERRLADLAYAKLLDKKAQEKLLKKKEKAFKKNAAKLKKKLDEYRKAAAKRASNAKAKLDRFKKGLKAGKDAFKAATSSSSSSSSSSTVNEELFL